MTMKAKYESSLTHDADGIEYERNITHVKKFLENYDNLQDFKPNDAESKPTSDDDKKFGTSNAEKPISL